jgi:hypothetical protein
VQKERGDGMSKREFLDTVFALAPNEANAIMDAFDEYVDSNEPHWIPVAERLPEVGKSVLICDAYGDICLGHRTSSGYYFPDFCEDKIKDVRAWCDLPEPFKGVTE